VLAFVILLPGLVAEQLPISNMGGCRLFCCVDGNISTTISVFYVSVGLDFVEKEAKFFIPNYLKG